MVFTREDILFNSISKKSKFDILKISMLNTIEILRSLALFLCIDNPISRSLWNLDIFPCSDEFGIQFCLKHFIYHVYYRQKLNWKPSFNGLFVHVNTQSVIIAFPLWFSHLARIITLSCHGYSSHRVLLVCCQTWKFYLL